GKHNLCYNYSTFNVSDASTEYILTVGGYSGAAGDSLAYHNGSRFSTYDNDASGGNYAHERNGAWWYGGSECDRSNLNGPYIGKGYDDDAITWQDWKGYHSLKFTQIKTRRNN
ncbi:PREDICTED: tenascin-R-like, partial [Amphimedon queenslandica]|uniref:Fibrinogen C-terminal domain-containing protein n=1 Tax=Amphimedon queenslandica TaxID=400682 RepID=A0AAN0JVV4_AMPQE